MEDSGRLAVYLLWAAGSVLSWGLVFINGLRDYRAQRDSRSIRELASTFALFVVAVASAISIVALLMGPEVQGSRGFWLAFALGAFLAAGIVAATIRRR